MKSSKQAEAPFVESPAGMGADCCFTYDGIQLPALGGIAPGDTIFVHRTNVTRSDGPVAVQFDGENVLCWRSKTSLGDLYSPLDPRTPGRFLTDQDGETVLIGEVVGLARYFSRLTEVQNNEI